MAVAEHHRHRRRPVRAAGNETVELLKRVALLARGVLYAVITLAFLIPLIWMLFGSVRRETEIFGMLYRSAGIPSSRSSGRWSTSGTSSA